jgi:hypothetical protein
MVRTGEVSEAEAREALARVLASEGFRAAPRLAAFLAFVVEQTLAGEAATLKGYTIATGALGRPPDFDPQFDPIVRVEAGRLRRALDAYYAGPGRADPVLIAIPRGRYVPSFAAAAPAPCEDIASPVVLPAPRRSWSASPAALAVTAAVLGFALGVYATVLLVPRDLTGAFAASAIVRTD